MLKYLFALVVCMHGLIHALGFLKAFHLGGEQITKAVSKPLGLVWLAVMMMFIITAIFFLLKEKHWPLVSMVAVLLSQILIIIFWKDAKMGTAVNAVILFIALPAYAQEAFSLSSEIQSTTLLESFDNNDIITHNDVEHLPPIVQKCLHNSGAIGKSKAGTVRLKQKGKMKLKPDADWMDFNAEQYFNLKDPAFVWTTKVQMSSLVYFNGRDELKEGKGKMLIKAQSLINMVNEYDNEKINSGALIRFLGESSWFPQFFASDYMEWEELGPTTARATLTYQDLKAQGTFEFTADGDVKSFSTQRYYGAGKEATEENWIVEMESYKNLDGVKVPNKCKVTWKLNEGDFNWLILEIVDLAYNPDGLYETPLGSQ